MKKQMLLLAPLLFLAWSSPSWAKVMIFDDLYTIDVPGGWRITQENGIVTLVSSDRQAAFLITRGLSVKAHQKKVARELSKYSNITQANQNQVVTITPLQSLRVVVTIVGDHPDRTGVYYSIKEKEGRPAELKGLRPKTKRQ